MKKILAVLFILFIFNGGFAIAKTFSDINQEDDNYLATKYLSAKGIVSGYEDGSFKPNQEINRAELLKILLEGANLKTTPTQTNCFNDTPYLEWYSPYICTAKSMKIVNGYQDGSFKPWQTVTRAEALKMIGKVYEWNLQNEETDNWYEPYFKFAKEKDLFIENE